MILVLFFIRFNNDSEWHLNNFIDKYEPEYSLYHFIVLGLCVIMLFYMCLRECLYYDMRDCWSLFLCCN